MSDIMRVNSNTVAEIDTLRNEKSVQELRKAAMAAGIDINTETLAARCDFGVKFTPFMRGYITESTQYGNEILRRELGALEQMLSRAKSVRAKLSAAKAINDSLRTLAVMAEIALKTAEIAGAVEKNEKKANAMREVTVNTEMTFIGMPQGETPKPIASPNREIEDQ